MEIEPVRLFEQTSPNTFEPINPDIQSSSAELDQQTSHRHRKIRPMIYKTFLKTKQIETIAKVRFRSYNGNDTL